MLLASKHSLDADGFELWEWGAVRGENSPGRVPNDDDWPHASRTGCQGGDVVDQVSPVSDEPTAASPGGAKQTNPRQSQESHSMASLGM